MTNEEKPCCPSYDPSKALLFFFNSFLIYVLHVSNTYFWFLYFFAQSSFLNHLGSIVWFYFPFYSLTMGQYLPWAIVPTTFNQPSAIHIHAHTFFVIVILSQPRSAFPSGQRLKFLSSCRLPLFTAQSLLLTQFIIPHYVFFVGSINRWMQKSNIYVLSAGKNGKRANH